MSLMKNKHFSTRLGPQMKHSAGKKLQFNFSMRLAKLNSLLLIQDQHHQQEPTTGSIPFFPPPRPVFPTINTFDFKASPAYIAGVKRYRKEQIKEKKKQKLADLEVKFARQAERDFQCVKVVENGFDKDNCCLNYYQTMTCISSSNLTTTTKTVILTRPTLTRTKTNNNNNNTSNRQTSQKNQNRSNIEVIVLD